MNWDWNQKMEKLRLQDELLRLDRLAERAISNASERIALAGALTIEASPLKPPTGQGDEIDKLISMAAVSAETARMRIWTSDGKPNDDAAREVAETAIGNLREVLGRTIALLNEGQNPDCTVPTRATLCR
jgi:hypothetical protein